MRSRGVNVPINRALKNFLTSETFWRFSSWIPKIIIETQIPDFSRHSWKIIEQNPWRNLCRNCRNNCCSICWYETSNKILEKKTNNIFLYYSRLVWKKCRSNLKIKCIKIRQKRMLLLNCLCCIAKSFKRLTNCPNVL